MSRYDISIWAVIGAVFILVTSIKILTRSYIDTIHYFGSDESIYLIMMCDPIAHQIVNQFHYQLLYPIILYCFMSVPSFSAAQIVNAVLSTSIVIPIYLLGRKFLSSYQAVLIAILAVFLPLNFHFSYHIMAENLFYPLAMWSVLGILTVEHNKKYMIPTGIVLFLTCMTKISGIAIVLAYGIIIFIKWYRKEDISRHRFVFGIAGVFLLIFFVYQAVVHGITENALIGYNLSTPIMDGFKFNIDGIVKIIIGHGMVLIGSTCGLVSLFWFSPRDKSIILLRDFTLILSGLLILVASLFIAPENRLSSRYICTVMPLLLVLIVYYINNDLTVKQKRYVLVGSFSLFMLSIWYIYTVFDGTSELESLQLFIDSLHALNIFLVSVIVICTFFTGFYIVLYMPQPLKMWILFLLLLMLFAVNIAYSTKLDHETGLAVMMGCVSK